MGVYILSSWKLRLVAVELVENPLTPKTMFEIIGSVECAEDASIHFKNISSPVATVFIHPAHPCRKIKCSILKQIRKFVLNRYKKKSRFTENLPYSQEMVLKTMYLNERL